MPFIQTGMIVMFGKISGMIEEVRYEQIDLDKAGIYEAYVIVEDDNVTQATVDLKLKKGWSSWREIDPRFGTDKTISRARPAYFHTMR